MTKIEAILSDVSHRPYQLPNGPWQYYQEWNKVLFLHWAIPYGTLRKCVPSSLNIDTINGQCYVSLVAFTMEKIRPRYLPAMGLISNFDEINLRTYIDNDNKKGVYFLNIEVGKALSAFLAKALSGLPYGMSDISRGENNYWSQNLTKGFNVDAGFEIKSEIQHKTELDLWLTERYCLYFDIDNQFYRYDIHHKAWDLKNVEIKNLSLNYNMGDFNLASTQPSCSHYSEGVKVLSWKKQKT